MVNFVQFNNANGTILATFIVVQMNRNYYEQHAGEMNLFTSSLLTSDFHVITEKAQTEKVSIEKPRPRILNRDRHESRKAWTARSMKRTNEVTKSSETKLQIFRKHDKNVILNERYVRFQPDSFLLKWYRTCQVGYSVFSYSRYLRCLAGDCKPGAGWFKRKIVWSLQRTCFLHKDWERHMRPSA